MVLVFSKAANNSEEIKKELSLASRYHVPVIALRIQDVEPTDAFAYELSTRQWIDAFEGWDKSLDLLVSRIGQIEGTEAVAANSPPGRAARSRRTFAIAAGGIILLLVAASAWLLRPAAASSHSMTVRLAGFQLLSSDLPKTLPDAVNTE